MSKAKRMDSEALNSLIKSFEATVTEYRNLGIEDDSLDAFGKLVGLSQSLQEESGRQNAEGKERISQVLSALPKLMEECGAQAEDGIDRKSVV